MLYKKKIIPLRAELLDSFGRLVQKGDYLIVPKLNNIQYIKFYQLEANYIYSTDQRYISLIDYVAKSQRITHPLYRHKVLAKDKHELANFINDLNTNAAFRQRIRPIKYPYWLGRWDYTDLTPQNIDLELQKPMSTFKWNKAFLITDIEVKEKLDLLPWKEL